MSCHAQTSRRTARRRRRSGSPLHIAAAASPFSARRPGLGIERSTAGEQRAMPILNLVQSHEHSTIGEQCAMPILNLVQSHEHSTAGEQCAMPSVNVANKHCALQSATPRAVQGVIVAQSVTMPRIYPNIEAGSTGLSVTSDGAERIAARGNESETQEDF